MNRAQRRRQAATGGRVFSLLSRDELFRRDHVADANLLAKSLNAHAYVKRGRR